MPGGDYPVPVIHFHGLSDNLIPYVPDRSDIQVLLFRNCVVKTGAAFTAVFRVPVEPRTAFRARPPLCFSLQPGF